MSDSAPIIFLTHEFAPFRGGAAVYVQETAMTAARLGFPVEVWTVDYRGRGLKGEECSTWNFPVERLPSDGRLSPGGLLGLAWGLHRRRERLRRARRVVLLSVGAQMAWAGLDALGLAAAAPVTAFFHGSEILRFNRSAFWRGRMRRLYARAAGFAVNSRYVRGLLADSGLLPDGAKIALAPCACPTALQREVTPPAPDGKLRVLTAARLHPRKGQLDLARALAFLPSNVKARLIYQMVGIGEESYRREIEQTCRTGSIACEFLGALPDADLAAAYARCDIYAQISRSLKRSVEGFGLTYLEASFHGCPIVAARTGGVAEAVLDKETGLLVPENDLPAAAAAITRLFADNPLRLRLGRNGRRHACSFRWDDAARALCGTDDPRHCPTVFGDVLTGGVGDQINSSLS